jgi:hypothetical protein
MIIQEQVEVIPSGKMIKYFRDLNYEVEWRVPLMVKVIDLPKVSHIKIQVKCEICGNIKKLTYNNYVVNTKSFTQKYSCNNKCSNFKNKISLLEKYGDENYNNRKKFSATNLERFGVPNFTQTEEFNEKTKYSCLLKYGVEHHLQSDIVKDKIKQTNILKRGVEYPMQSDSVRSKSKITLLDRYGVEHISKSEEIKHKKKLTCLENNGVEYPLQNEKIFKKSLENSFLAKKFKNTNLIYQGSYEKYFLELMEQCGQIDLIKNGKKYEYFFCNQIHYYFSDFIYANNTIEIKSSWTYNRNGKDKILELINESKWQSVRDLGDNMIILKSKDEIKNYVKNLDIIIKLNKI